MKVPKRPPSVMDLFGTIEKTPGLLTKILSFPTGPNVQGKYLHWDKLRFHEPPKGLSLEQWWFAIKFRRRGFYKPIPLMDKDSKPFQFLEVDPMRERLHQIDQGSGGMIQMPEPITNPDTRDQYYVSSLIEEAITSSQLEGAVTTREVAKEMIKTHRSPVDRSEQMILNNFQTMQRIAAVKKEPLSKALILELHHLVTAKTLDDASAEGRYRTSDEKVVVGDMYNEVIHDPPPAAQLEDRMKVLCDFANGKSPAFFVHPVIRSILLHFWLAYDHPFVDGNGRTARALFYWSMLHQGYWLFEFVSISQMILMAPAKYARAFLYTETDDNDLTYFILYHLEVIRQAIEQLHRYIRKKTGELKQAEQRMRGIRTFNHRQRALISHALRHPHQRYAIRAHQISHNVVYQTARTDLLDLKQRGLFTDQKMGRTIHFLPVEGLEEKLSQLP